MTRETETPIEIRATYGIADASGLIINTVEIDLSRPIPDIPGLFVPPPGVVPVIGGHWDGVTVTPPPPPAEVVPDRISAFQARAALTAAGLRDQVEAAVAAADQTTRDAWEYATSLDRRSPTLATLAAALGLGDEQIDDLFRQASGIVA